MISPVCQIGLRIWAWIDSKSLANFYPLLSLACPRCFMGSYRLNVFLCLTCWMLRSSLMTISHAQNPCGKSLLVCIGIRWLSPFLFDYLHVPLSVFLVPLDCMDLHWGLLSSWWIFHHVGFHFSEYMKNSLFLFPSLFTCCCYVSFNSVVSYLHFPLAVNKFSFSLS